MQVYSIKKNSLRIIRQLAIIFIIICGFFVDAKSQTIYPKVFSKYNYYTTEDSIAIIAKLNGNSHFNDYQITLFNNKNEKILHSQFTSATLKINLPLSQYVIGETQIIAHISENHHLIKTDTVKIQHLAPANNEVKIDLETGGLIADGRPFFPFGFYCGPVNDLPEQEVVKGFNMIGPYQSNLPEGIDLRKEYMDRCAALGIKVQYSVNSLIGSGHNGAKGLDKTEEEKFELLKNEILTFKDHPALLSWYINDEPDGQGRPPELLEKAYNFIHQLDPYHPVSIVFMMPSKVDAFRNTMDIAMTDPYPIPKSVGSVQDYVDQLFQLFQHEKSVWLVPQAFGGSEMWPREPSAQEIRAMTYLGLAYGAKGIQYFIRSKDNLNPQSVSAWAECSKMAVELKNMAPFLLSDEKSEVLKTNDSEIIARYFSYKNEKLVIVVNKSNTPEPFIAQFKEYVSPNSNIEVCFENRELTTNSGAIEDIIDALGTRVYMIKPNNSENKQTDGNLIYNPGFEKTTNPGLADGQSLSYSFPQKADPGATVFIDSKESIEGKYSLQITNPADSAGKKVKFIPIILKSGNTYSTSIWAKSSDKTSSPRFKFSIETAGQEKIFELSNQWKEYSFYFKADTTTTNAIVQLELLDKGTAWFDQLKIAPDPIINYTINENKTATVSIHTNLKNASLKYALNNKKMTPYKQPFNIKNASEIKAVLVEKQKTLAESKIFVPVNKALGKPISYDTKYHDNYKAQGDSGLTNAIMGTTSFKDGNWLGFLDSTVVFTIDMEKKTEINNVTINLLCDPNSGIFLPKEAFVYTSNSGVDFKLSAEKKNNMVSKRGEPYLVPFKVNCNKTNARYVRIVIKTFGEIPEGYLFKGTNSWMFTDEVLIQ